MQSSKKYLITLFLLLAFVFGAFINGTPFIFSDGYGYFHVAKTLVTEGNFVTETQPEYYPYTRHAVTYKNGKYITVYSAGSAILMWPFMTASKYIQATIHPNSTVYNDYYKAFDGISIEDGIATIIASSFYAFITLILIYKILKNLGFTDKVSVISTLLVYVGSFALYYIFESPSYSHTFELFAVAALIYSTIKFGKLFQYRYMLLAGIFAGLLVIIRPADVLIVIPIFLYNLFYRNIKSAAWIIVGSLPFAAIFLYYNKISYDCYLCSSYKVLWNQDFSATQFQLFNLLFSDIRGWLIYSPIMIFGIIGLFFYARKSIQSTLLYILPVILTILIYSFWPIWWAGDSVGQRFLLVLVPFMAIGIAALIRGILRAEQQVQVSKFITSKFKSVVIKSFFVIIILLLISLSSYSFLTYLLARVTPLQHLNENNQLTARIYPEISAAERFTPFDIYDYQLNLLKNFKSQDNYIQKLKQGFSGGRSLLLLSLGLTDPIVKIENIDGNHFNLHIVPNNTKTPYIVSFSVKIKQDDKVISEFSVNDVDSSKPQSIEIACLKNECSITNSKLFDLSPINLKFDAEYIKLSDSYSISFGTSGHLKFVDYRLK